MTAFVGVLDNAVPHSVALANTNTTDIFSTPTTEGSIGKGIAVYVANESGGTIDVFIYRYDASATTEYTLWMKAVTTKSTEIIDLNSMRLDAGDEIRAKGNSGITVTAVIADYNGP